MPYYKEGEARLDKNKPDIDKVWFWEFDYDRIDWHKAYRTVIKRTLERGSKQEWKELVCFYGEEKVINTIKNEINYLPDYIIEEVCNLFKVKKQELKCYVRKQSLPGHWI